MTLKLVGSETPETQPGAGGNDLVRGHTVCYAGRLASMGHEAFVDVVTRHGGRFGQVDGPGGVIVVGEADWPLARPAGATGDRLKTMDALER